MKLKLTLLTLLALTAILLQGCVTLN